MPELIILESRVGAVEEDIRDIRVCQKEYAGRLDELEDDGISRSDRLLNLEIWHKGNGARGAEARLQGVENDIMTLRECLGASKSEEAIERIVAATARSIVKGARDRDRTAVEKIKAVAAILGPICAAVAVIIAAIVAATT